MIHSAVSMSVSNSALFLSETGYISDGQVRSSFVKPPTSILSTYPSMSQSTFLRGSFLSNDSIAKIIFSSLTVLYPPQLNR